jgi:hypothetical protein
MRQNRFPVIDGDGHITERSKEILEFLGGNYRGTSKEESWADTFSPFSSLDGWSRLSGMSSPGLRDYLPARTATRAVFSGHSLPAERWTSSGKGG